MQKLSVCRASFCVCIKEHCHWRLKILRISSEWEAKTDVLWMNLTLCADEAAFESGTKNSLLQSIRLHV